VTLKDRTKVDIVNKIATVEFENRVDEKLNIKRLEFS
jgi:hypothetical protein